MIRALWQAIVATLAVPLGILHDLRQLTFLNRCPATRAPIKGSTKK